MNVLKAYDKLGTFYFILAHKLPLNPPTASKSPNTATTTTTNVLPSSKSIIREAQNNLKAMKSSNNKNNALISFQGATRKSEFYRAQCFYQEAGRISALLYGPTHTNTQICKQRCLDALKYSNGLN